ncbi:hypothetical protein [Allorhizocola rhizosphaerae]|uniref:hypothetical protein n=1 Tax=Allorhizocola rhizosphaerae TaxID=1872709 RepID=UPI0013C323C1|nr:hypothetical protein [Allorhizocola rhizosphaerae]
MRSSLWGRAGGWNGVLLAGIIVALLRAAQLLVIHWMKPSALPGALLAWDGGWFINVATEGYPDGYTYDTSGVRVGNGFAFFPLWPGVIKTISLLGVPKEGSSLFAAFILGIAAGIGVYLLGTAIWSRGVGYALAVVVCGQPMSVVLLMGYTESLFLTLVTVTLIAAHQRVWWVAGVAGIAGALTRPTGMALALALALAVVLSWRESTARQRVWASTAAGASLMAGPLFLAWVGWRVGEWDAWFKVQTAGWGSTFDFGQSVVEFVAGTLRSGTAMVEAVTVWFLLGAVVFSLVAVWQRIWPPLAAFGLLALGLVVGQAGYWHSKPRLLIPVLLLAGVPVAQALARAPRTTAVAALAVWSAFGLWFGAHMITVWPFTI